MILKSARITSFRSIEDSGEFSIDRVTGLVGENGAGKSTILEALYKLNPVSSSDEAFSQFDYPRKKYAAYRSQHATKPATVVSTTWELDRADRDLLAPIIGMPAADSLTIQISKGYDNQLKWVVDLDEGAVVQRERFANGDLQTIIVDKLKDRLPKFVYVTEYPKVPGDVALDTFMALRAEERSTISNRVFLALLKLAGLDPEVMQHIDHSEELIAELEAASECVTQEVFRHWGDGNQLRVEFRCEAARAGDRSPAGGGYVFRTRVRDARLGYTLGLEQQGAGIVGYLSFAVWMWHLKQTYGERLVFLLDQPGNTLHAQAQQDLAKHISHTCRSGDTIVYTAPSITMMSDDDLTSIRVVAMARADESAEGARVLEERRLPALRAAVTSVSSTETRVPVPPVSRDLPPASFDAPIRLLDAPVPEMQNFPARRAGSRRRLSRHPGVVAGRAFVLASP